jgi:hypothetical protein
MKKNGVAIVCLLLAACGGGGGAGGSGSSSSGGNPPAPPPVDSTPPQTRLDASPAATIYTDSATIAFSADEAGATFEGSLDGAPFATVTSPVTLNALADGAHTYEVRAKDAAGNADASPARAQWSVLAGPPDTSIDASPAAATNSSDATFSFSSNKPDSTFEVSVDGAAFTAGQSPLALGGLGTGAHSFTVRATDNDDQVDASPATFHWVVDVLPPTAKIRFPTPVSYTDAATLTVRGTAADANGVGSVSVNGVAATSIDGFENWRANVPLSAVTTTVTVSVTDAAGNTTASADSVVVTNRGPVLAGYTNLDFDPNGHQVIALDRYADAVYGYDANTGVGRLISKGPSPGAQNGQTSATVIAVDATRNRALFVDYAIDALVAVDLATGARSLASPSQGQASPTSLVVANSLAVDPAGNRAFAANDMCHCIIGMNLDNATRSIVASAAVGSGAFPPGMLDLVYDDITTPNAPRLLTSSWMGPGVQEIIAIDVATGNRTVLSSFANSVGAGPDAGGAVSLSLDPLRHRLVTADNYLFGMMAIDLVTGDRSVILDHLDTGSGPLMYPTVGAAYDPVSNRLFSKQVLDDEIIVTDLAKQVRTPLIYSHVGSGPAPSSVDAIVLEQTSDAPSSLLFTQTYPASVMRLDLASGARSLVSDPNGSPAVGSGPILDGIVDLVLDTRPSAGPNQALALLGAPNNRLVSIDLVTGDRAQVADLNSASPAVTEPRYLELDVANNRVLFTDGDYYGDGDALYAIDLATGTRSTITSSSVGGGFALGYFADFVLEPASNPTRALVSDTFGQSYVVVDLASGSRSQFAGIMSGGANQQFNGPNLVYLDVPNWRLLAANGGSPSNFFSMSMETQVQRLISGHDLFTNALMGAGPEVYPGGFAVDSGNQVIYATAAGGTSLFAIDMVSGDRVIIGN